MHDVRPAAVAGTFYPGTPARLARDVRGFLAEARPSRSTVPKALIVPHAGYVYSGSIAATAYALLAPLRDVVTRVVLLGPAHRVAVRGLATTSAAAFATPLGEIAIDADAVAVALTFAQVVASDAAHAHEHALEVQLPFLQTVLRRFTLVPFAVGRATPLGEVPVDADAVGTALTFSQVAVSDAAHAGEHALEVQLPFLQTVLRRFTLVPLAVGHATLREVEEVLDALWGGPETLVVVSSDLSHYHAYAEAKRIDRATADAILAMSPTLDHEQACGATPVNALLQCASRRGLSPALLDLRNSGDTAGDRSRVVGYASFAFAADGAG